MIFSTFSNDEENDLEFVTRLYENYGKVMWKYAYKLSSDYDVSNDIVSMAFLKVIEKVEIVRKVRIYKIKSYLISIIKNTFLNYKKNEKFHINYDEINEIIFDYKSVTLLMNIIIQMLKKHLVICRSHINLYCITDMYMKNCHMTK